MEGGASARRLAARAARWLGWTLLSLCLLAVLVGVGVPLIVRGPVLARLVAHESKDLCGTARVAGGHVSLGLAPALLLQRPFEVVVDGARLIEPDGNHLFRARTVRARLRVRRHPWRLVVEQALISDGAWRLVAEAPGQPVSQALRKIPPAGRAACALPAAPEPPKPGKPSGSLLTIQAATLQRLSIELSFGSWGVALDGVDAHGTVEVRNAPAGTQFLFDARDIIAREGGTLRVGPRSASTPVFPFDHVEIPRVAVTADAPPDLLLTVAAARTGDAVLSGRARFTNVFAPDEWNLSSGMALDVRWTNVGLPLQRNAAWADVGKGLARQRTDLRADLHGPFDALTGVAALAGREFSLRADLLPRGRYALDVRLDNIDTTPFVPAERRELLAGRLNGHLSLSARFGPSAADAAASLDAIELALQRTHAGSTGGDLPVRWVVSRSFRARSPGELRLDLGKVGFAAGALEIDAFRVAAPSVVFGGRARAARRPESGDLLVNLWSQPGARFTWQGETFLPPAVLTAHVEPGRAVTVEPFSVEHVGGGAIDAGGKLRFDGRADLQVAVRAYPLARIPMLAGARAPGHDATVGALLRGQLDAKLAVAGRPQRPSLSGMLALSRVAWAGHGLGGGRVDLTGLPGGTRFAGQLLDGIDVRGTLHLPLKSQDQVTLALRNLALRPWLPTAVAPLDPRASGEIGWRRGGERGPDGDRSGEEVRVSRLAVSAQGAEVDATGALQIDRRDLGASAVSATVNARVAGPALARALFPKITGAGSADVDATVAGTIGAPQVRGATQFKGLSVSWPRSPFGAVRVDGPLGFEGRTLAVGPLAATFQSGGRLQIGGARGKGKVVLARRGASLPVSDVDLAVRASGITTAHPVAGLSVSGLGVDVRLTQPNATALRADGWVYLGRDFFQLNKGEEKKPPEKGTEKPAAPSARPPTPTFADHVSLRLRVVGPKNAMTVGVPYAPDVTVGADCLIEGPLTSPHLSGSIKGSGVYSRIALAVADRFTSRNLRACDFGPE